MPNLTIRTMERDAVTIIEFENTISIIAIFLKSLLVKAFAHSHFHEGGNLMTLRFCGVGVPIHVNLPKPKFATNPNSYGLNFLNLDFLPHGNTSAHHVFQVV